LKFLNILLNKTEEILVAIALAVSTIMAFIEVILRKFFGSSLGYTHETVVFLLILVGLIGASIGVREKVHLGVDILVKQFSYPVQKAVVLCTLTICTLFCLYVTFLGVQHVQVLVDFGLLSPEMRIPMWIPKGIVPVAFGLMTIRFIQEIFIAMKTPAEEILKQEEIH
jgi:C4-dicarboxylate transporter DctQ subunit